MPCEDKQSAVSQKTQQLVARLAEQAQALATDIRQKSNDIDPKIDTTGPDIWIGIDFDVRWEPAEFSLDLPEVRMVDQTWKLDLPQVTMKNQDIIFHTPSIRMKTVKTGEYPETVCRMVTKDIGFGVKTDIPECTVTWSPIYMDVPEPFMQEQRIVLSVPEIRMGLTEMVVRIPEVTMKTQKMSLHLPKFTLKNVSVEAKKAEEKGKALSEESRGRSAKLTQDFQENAKLEMGQDVKDLFYCYEQQLVAQKNNAAKQFEDGASLLQSTITAMVANKVPDDHQAMKDAKASLAKLIADRETFAENIEAGIRDLHRQQQEFFEKLVRTEAPAQKIAS